MYDSLLATRSSRRARSLDLNVNNDAHQLREAEEFLHASIPLTRAMGVRVVADDAREFVVTAPVALN